MSVNVKVPKGGYFVACNPLKMTTFIVDNSISQTNKKNESYEVCSIKNE